MDSSKYNSLNTDEQFVILHKGTEAPYSGEYESFFEKGTYHCRQCDEPLFLSRDKFHSNCGWPAFDDEIEGKVKRVPDADGRRVEIICANCGGHLGHVFEGEGFTRKNTRHCVNSVSLSFKPFKKQDHYKKAFFAAGCFWGVEYLFRSLHGVMKTSCGYMGGQKDDPTYKEVCYTDTGHLEAVEVIYDPSVVTFEELVKYFFEIHDPTQVGGQGPDRGPQYLSAIFSSDEKEVEIANNIIGSLESMGLSVTTTVRDSCQFWIAEEYHQDYYLKTGKQPYCHRYTKRF